MKKSYVRTFFAGVATNHQNIQFCQKLLNKKYTPFSFDIGASSNVVLGGEHKLVIQNPFRFVIQAGWRMQLYNLELVLFATKRRGTLI